MSLINEALRKARQAASEHDQKQVQGGFRPAKAYPSRRSGRRGRPVVVALVAVAAGVIGASAAWWYLNHEPAATTESVVIEAPATDAPGAVAKPEPPPITETTRSEQPAAPVATPAAVVAEERMTSEADQARVELQVEAAATEERSAEPAGDRVYVMEADLGDVTLSLGFIVARHDNPFAEINGVEVSVGSEIEGFVVEAIEADRVVLRDDKGPLVLRVP